MGFSGGRSAAVLAVLGLLLATPSQAAGDAGSAELPAVLQEAHADAVASRRLLRASHNGNWPVLSITWNLKGPIQRWVRAGSVVQFSWSRPGGLAYGYSRCRPSGTLKKPCGKAVVAVKIPRGRFWFFDNYRSNCGKQAIYIIGY